MFLMRQDTNYRFLIKRAFFKKNELTESIHKSKKIYGSL